MNEVSKEYPLVETGLGFGLYIDPMDSYGFQNAGPGYERHEVETFKRLVKPGDRVFDIGANMGYFTILFSRLVGPAGHVMAFEPDEESLLLLQKNIELNHAKNVQVFPVALSEKASEGILYRCPFNVAMHRLYPSVCCDTEGKTVSVLRGDDLGLGAPDFVKIDVEGFELPVLRGLENTLHRNSSLFLLSEFSPLSMLEAGYHPREFLTFVKHLGLRLMVLSGDEWKAAEWRELESAVSVFSFESFSRFHKEAAVGPKGALLDVSLNYLAEIGYSREYFENILLLGRDAEYGG